MMNKKILKNLSSTQRLVVDNVRVNGEDRVELRKEFRKSINSDWIPSKGITIPISTIPKLVTILCEISDTDVDDSE